MKVLTTRVGEEIIRDLDNIGAEEKADRSEVARRLLDKSIKQWKLEKALKMISSSTWTMRRAAGYAGLPYHQMLDEMTMHDIDSGPRLIDLGQSQ